MYDCYVIKVLCAASHTAVCIVCHALFASRTLECSVTHCVTAVWLLAALCGNDKVKTRLHGFEVEQESSRVAPCFCRCTRGAATCVDSSVTSAAPSPYLSRQRCIHSFVMFGHMFTYFLTCLFCGVFLFVFFYPDINFAVFAPLTILVKS